MPCNKKCLSKSDAEIIVYRGGYLRKQHKRTKRLECRKYYCKECEAWHTTSKKKGEFKD